MKISEINGVKLFGRGVRDGGLGMGYCGEGGGIVPSAPT